jgi:hypothetical protein
MICGVRYPRQYRRKAPGGCANCEADCPAKVAPTMSSNRESTIQSRNIFLLSSTVMLLFPTVATVYPATAKASNGSVLGYRDTLWGTAPSSLDYAHRRSRCFRPVRHHYANCGISLFTDNQKPSRTWRYFKLDTYANSNSTSN